jgi:hypothetical protein
MYGTEDDYKDIVLYMNSITQAISDIDKCLPPNPDLITDGKTFIRHYK